MSAFINELKAFFANHSPPDRHQAIRHVLQRCLGALALGTRGPCQRQEGVHQLPHLIGGPRNPAHLGHRTLIQRRVTEQQFAGAGQHHQRCAQFVTDVTGEQLFPAQRIAQAPQGLVEGQRQIPHFIHGVIRMQRRRYIQQLVAMTHLPRQAYHRRHHAARQQAAQQDRQQNAQDKTHRHRAEQHPLALLKALLVAHQHVLAPIHHLRHRVVGPPLKVDFLETRRQPGQQRVKRQVTLLALGEKQFAFARAMAPTGRVILAQQAVQPAAEVGAGQFVFDHMHGGDNARGKHPRHEGAHQRKHNHDPFRQAVPEIHCHTGSHGCVQPEIPAESGTAFRRRRSNQP